MRLQHLTLVFASAVLLVSCSGSPAPVPMVGQPADVSRLAGEWYGEYSSVESGRSGSITFKLNAGTDSASGDVIMSPQWNVRPQSGQQPGAGATPPTAAQVLAINFVRVAGGDVSGSLAPYTDPTCGCTLHTTFIGRLQSDTLAGTYTSLHEQSRVTQQGRWRVVRQKNG